MNDPSSQSSTKSSDSNSVKSSGVENDNMDQVFEDETRAALCLNLVPGVGPRTFADLVDTFGSPSKVFSAEPAKLREVRGVGAKLVREIVAAPQTANVQEQISICENNDIQILNQDSKQYPKQLKAIFDPPSILFVQGNILPADNISIAIVGSRHATNYGIRTASRLARGLAMAGVTIVSGSGTRNRCSRPPWSVGGRWSNVGGARWRTLAALPARTCGVGQRYFQSRCRNY